MDRNEGLREISRLCGDRYSDDEAELDGYGNRETWLRPQRPWAAVSPVSEAEVADIVRICARHRLPIVAQGAATSLEGQINAPHGGVLMRMDRLAGIVTIDERSMVAKVQPGVTREALDEALSRWGLFFPVDPSPGATLGGMASTRASGTNAVRYGTIADNIRSMRVVLASGDVIETGTQAHKSASGYDLTKLFVGSEGTLGIITELTVRTWPLAEHTIAGRCSFSTLEAACDGVMRLMKSGHRPEKVEIVDALGIAACNRYFSFSYPETPTIFFQFSGPRGEVRDGVEAFAAIAKASGSTQFASGGTEGERQELWAARKKAWWAFRALRPDAMPVSTDACVPLSRLAECIGSTQAEIKERGLTAPIIGHVGDGNFHALVLVDLDDQDEVRSAKDFIANLGRRAIAMGGTCSGEHGIGQGKADLFMLERGGAVSVMDAIKRSIDPDNILNPGKLWQASSPP